MLGIKSLKDKISDLGIEKFNSKIFPEVTSLAGKITVLVVFFRLVATNLSFTLGAFVL